MFAIRRPAHHEILTRPSDGGCFLAAIDRQNVNVTVIAGLANGKVEGNVATVRREKHVPWTTRSDGFEHAQRPVRWGNQSDHIGLVPASDGPDDPSSIRGPIARNYRCNIRTAV